MEITNTIGYLRVGKVETHYKRNEAWKLIRDAYATQFHRTSNQVVKKPEIYVSWNNYPLTVSSLRSLLDLSTGHDRALDDFTQVSEISDKVHLN